MLVGRDKDGKYRKKRVQRDSGSQIVVHVQLVMQWFIFVCEFLMSFVLSIMDLSRFSIE